MNREIIFKAKRKSWKELPKEEWWVEGYLFDDGMPEPKHYFIGGIIVKPYEGTACDKWNVVGIDFCEIDINTLCQYTGLTDKNDKKIWENDIVELPDKEGYFTCEWEEDAERFVMNGDGLTVDFDNYWSYQTEVAGNIFDNPELLEVDR